MRSLISGVEVGPIGSDELGNIVDHLGSLGSEEFIYVCIGFDIHRVGDNIPHPHLAEVVTRLVLYPMNAQVFDNVGKGCPWLRVQGVNEFDNLYLLWDGAVHTGLDAVHDDVLKFAPIRHSTAHEKPLAASGAISANHTLLDGLTFKLGKHHDNHQYGLADWG